MFVKNKGYTLVEVLFSVSFLGLLILMLSSLDHSALMIEKRVDFVAYNQQVISIVQILAQDIHAAERMKLQSSSLLTLEMNGRQVKWSSGSDKVTRIIGKTRQQWLIKKGILFRETGTEGMVEIFVPSLSLYSFYSIRGGIH